MRIGRRLNGDFVAWLEDQEPPRLELVAGDIDGAVDDVERPLFVPRVERQRRAGAERDIGEQRVVHRRNRRRLAVDRTDDHAHEGAVVIDHREFIDVVMREARVHLLLRRGQRDPHLQAVDRPAGGALFGAGALGMHDAAPGRHPVYFTRPDRHGGAETVAVHDLAVEQIGDSGEPDMRMRAHVESVAGAEFRRPEMVEER